MSAPNSHSNSAISQCKAPSYANGEQPTDRMSTGKAAAADGAALNPGSDNGTRGAMGQLAPYPEYKDSGVEWLGVVPEGWAIGTFKNMGWIRNGRDHKEVESPDGEYPVIGSGGQFSTATKYLYDGESVLLGRKGTIDKPLYINGRFWTVDTMFYTEVFKGVSARFLYYCAMTIPFKFYSTSTAVPSMTQGDLLNHPTAIPPEIEQYQIARFLDFETARIDSLIEEQRRLVGLLKEKRQTVISHAVTKGLDPSVPMKNSEVKWLGEVPAHWKVVRLKNISRIVDCKNRTPEYMDDGNYLVVRTTNVKNNNLTFEGGLYTDRDNFKIWTERGVPPPGSILFTREAPAGEICLVPDGVPLCMGQRMMNIIPTDHLVTPFLFDFLSSDCLVKYIESESSGSTVSHLRVEQVFNIPLAIPPANERAEIDKLVRELKKKYAVLIDQATQSTEFLKEHRSALIFAAVTGKIDIRGWRPSRSAPIFTADVEVV
ncbi:restriction endonuclease subunit S [Pseudomonas sp. NPDC086251]|uniref:restriction endonuclease subunit S n=1 Tax=Pseudomonas sp. NPDC086251 TaxID=3364431 RepID=UPI003837EDE5